jgi:hypothetical protein
VFRFQLAQVRELGGYLLGRRLYERMLVWETDPSLRDTELRAAFANDQERPNTRRSAPDRPPSMWDVIRRDTLDGSQAQE